MSDVTDAALKLTAASVLRPAGAMMGFNGPLLPALVPDPLLQTALDEALVALKNQLVADDIAQPDLGLPTTLDGFSFAVADMSEDPQNADPRIRAFGLEKPAYAFLRDTDTIPIGSLAKLLPLYAAHQLRVDAQALASVITPRPTIGALAGLLREHYRAMGAADDTFPLIEDILTIDAAGVVDFAKGGTRWTTAPPTSELDLDNLNSEDHPGPNWALDDTEAAGPPDPPGPRVLALRGHLRGGPVARATLLRDQLAQVAFHENLRLMAGWSNNAAASIVTQSLGFPYLWQLGKRSGLFRQKGWERLADPRKGELEKPGGLSLTRDYARNDWSPLPRGVAVKYPQAGNARSVAQLMVSLYQRLLNEEAHISMREMLRKNQFFVHPTGRGEDAPTGRGLLQTTTPWNALQEIWDYGPVPAAGNPQRESLLHGELAAAKIGLLTEPLKDGTTNFYASNAVLVRVNRMTNGGAPMKITAVLVVLGRRKGIILPRLKYVMRMFGKHMCAKLELRHGTV